MDERALMEHVAGEGLLGSYVQYARTLTAAPLAYHVATGLSIIAGAVGSNVTFVGGGGTEHWPNLYVCILGPTGFHKTTAIRIGCRLLDRAAPGTIAPNEFSREQFLSNLQRNPNTLLRVDEFSTLLSQMERNYQAGLKETLTDLYDPHQQYIRTLRGEKGAGETIRIMRPALTILAGSNIDWLVSHLTEVDFRSGFMPRFLLWPASIKEPEPKDGMLTEPDPLQENALVKQLHALATNDRPSLAFSREAKLSIRRFSDEQKAVSESEPLPSELVGLLNRVGLYCAKISALLVVADEGAQRSYEVGPDQARRACMLMQWLIDQAQELFERHIVFERFEKKVQRVLALCSQEMNDWSVVLKRSKLPARELEDVVKTLIERGELQEGHDRTQGRPRRWLRRLYPELAKKVKEGEESVNEVGKKFVDDSPVVEFPLRRADRRD